jgi:hypothetical protein
MKRFGVALGGEGKEAHVAVPYLLLDVDEDKRILISQWARADEQFANQFIEGEVDRRVIPKLAEAFATINLSECDPNLNQGMKESFNEMAPMFDKAFETLLNPEIPAKDHCVKYARDTLGAERLSEIRTAMRASDQKHEFLNHGDAHSFNILVEAKPDINKLEQFGENADFYICDWEMAYSGPKGHDVGTFSSFPIASAYFHAARGYTDKANELIGSVRAFWDAYANTLVVKGNKDDQFLADTYRGSLAYCGYFAFNISYLLDIHNELHNTEGLTPEEVAKVIATFGVAGAKMMEMGFMNVNPDYSVDQLRDWFNQIVSQDMTSLSEVSKNRQRHRPRRQSSLLRASGRRVSDASVVETAVRRMSLLLDPNLSAELKLEEED